ncbi:ankyrin repeat-containing domain protein, partial [Armillaria luteobubalina]
DPESDNDSEDEEFLYPGVDAPNTTTGDNGHVPTPPAPSPAQLEALYAAASSGDLPLLKKLFATALESSNIGSFSLANVASSRTGFTTLHAAASRGYLDVVTWLVEDCGAMPDLEDKEGETALHKASLNGHLPIVSYLLPDKADVHAKDDDGWTALHNACSKGYLDIVRCICENGGADLDSDGTRRVDARSKGGWTPLS